MAKKQPPRWLCRQPCPAPASPPAAPHRRKLEGLGELTAAALVLDGGDGALVPPVDGLWQLLADVVAVAVAPKAGPTALAGGAGAEVDGAVLFVGYVGEAVEAEAEGVVAGVGGGVVGVDETDVVLEDLEPPLFLLERVVRPPVLREPPLVEEPHLLFAPLQPPHSVGFVVRPRRPRPGKRGGAGRRWIEEEGREEGDGGDRQEVAVRRAVRGGD
uniref:Uncharacterized protein LOC114914080 n=1 Tax=Elaeis guineensis var. tenera TaxID=51953 RepID=A0A8N4F2E6_ELAGV|nr:uncharacterized protein LOC114914080 [Elaeis guineensis]